MSSNLFQVFELVTILTVSYAVLCPLLYWAIRFSPLATQRNSASPRIPRSIG